MSAPSWHAPTQWAQPYRALTWLSALVLTLGFFTMGGYLPKAMAYEAATGVWTAGGVLTMPSALTATVTTTGSTALNGVTTLGTRGFAAATYTPANMVTGDSTMDIVVNAGACAATGTCPGLGTLTVTFSQPVRNPTIDFAGLGAAVGNGTQQSDFHAYFDLATAGVTMTQASSNGNMTVAGSRITAVNDSTSTSCTTTADGNNFLNAGSAASCGSVKFAGTVTTLTFNVGTIWVKNPNATNGTTLNTAADAFAMTVTVPQDFSDAPASYNGAQAPAHVLSNLTLGATVDEDNAGVRNATAAPWAAAAANGDDTSGTDDEDAFTTLPDAVAVPGATYSLTVPIAGLSKAATLCGWIDFDRNGTFDTGERQCATPGAGATSATLTWTVTSGVSVGASNARFRLGYTAAQVQSPTGLADSGEVEDYPISFLARPQIILTKTTTGAVGGPFTYALTNTTQTTGTVTTATAGTAVQVDGDTTTAGTQAYTATSVGTAVTITEAALSGWAVTAATCTNSSGAVGSASGDTYTIPASAIVPGAVITCAYTNAKPGVSFDKQAGAIIDLDGNGPDAGDHVPYSFVVTNTGQTSLSGIVVTDPKVTGISCPVTTLAVGAGTTCTATYTLTQADVTSGSVVNTAGVTANPPTGAALSASDTNTVSIPANPSIKLTKSAGAPTGNTAGSTVTYTFVVLNNGNLPLTSVGVSDPLVGTVTCPVTSLDPGASTTCTKTYTLAQADVNAGTVVNTATASGLSPASVNVTSTSSATITIARTATMTLAKTAGTPSGTTAGSTLAYSFLVTNTGNVTLTGIVIADAKVTSYTCPTTTLLPGASTTCTGSHTLTQAEIDAGSVTNQATVTGTPPTGMSAPTANGSTTTTLARNPAISLDKQFSGMSGQTVGSTISYSFVVSNTGNVTLTGIWLLDANVPSFSCPTTTLAVGASTTCTGSHPLTQADIDSGHLLNTATATGYGPNGAATSANDSVDTTVTPGPAITLAKSAGAPSGSTAGSTVPYSFLVKNTGNVTLTSVGVTDPKVGTVSCPVSSLAPNATTTCTKTYTLTQADVNAGSVVNTATASGKSPAGATVQATSSTTSTVTRTATFTFDKQAGAPTGTTAGSTITYSFVFQNTGNVTLTALSVSDAKVGSVTCPATLAPGATATCTATYTITQNDVDAGHVANTANAGATPPSGMTPPTGTDSTDTAIVRAPAITLDKQAGTPSAMTAGSTITYSFVITNSGNVSLTSVGVTDAKVGPVTCTVTTLLPGASTTCTKVYTLTQADVNAGVVNNTASATGTPPSGAAVTSTDSTSTTITRTPAISLVKSAGALSGSVAGATLPYTFVVKNTGNVTLNTVGVSDSKVGTVSCPVTSLLPGVSTSCTATYTVTQADVDAGVVNNTATASGTPPTGSAVTGTSSTTTPVTRSPAITLTKSAGAPSGMTAGSTIAYSFLAKNTGNVTLTSVGVSDPKVGTVSCPVTQLAPAATTTCTKTYTLSQADVDAGTVNNTATATGTPPSGSAITATSSVVSPITRTPAILLDKQAGAPTGTTVGSTIAYLFLVKNTGNVTMASVSVADAKVGAVTCPTGSFLPGATVTCTASYTLTQNDVNAGHVANTATATGTPTSGAAVTSSDSTDTTIPSGPAITLKKTAGTPSASAAGATIAYTFLVTNTGNVTLTSVGVTDAKVGTVSCPVTTLAPNASTTCTATYTLTQADVDAGVVNNTASASGTPPTGAAVTAPSTVSTTITRSPAVTVKKSAVTPIATTAGSTISYRFLVTNTGNVTLASVVVTDPKVGAISCPATTLLPAATTTCTGTYTLTQAEVDAGKVVNTASVAANPPSGAAVTATDTITTPITSAPSITLKKTAGAASGGAAGATIPYTFLVTNTGNVTLTSVSVTDAKVGTVSCPVTPLAPAASTTCTATYTLKQIDVDAGRVLNSATASANPPTGAAVSATDSVTATIPSTPAIALDKQAGTPSGNSAGSTVPYTFLVTNTGNVTLTGVAVTDAKVGTVTCPATTLVPGASTTCTATYSLTQADVDAGQLVNIGHVTANPPAGNPVTATDTNTLTIPAAASITLDKQSGTPSGTAAGATIAYTFIVTNTGNVTLSTVGVTDAKTGPITCPASSLAPGATTTCTKTYTLTQTDVDAGHVANTATAHGTPPSGPVVSGVDSTDTAIAAAPAMTLVKSAGTPSANTAGAMIAYSFVIKNTGNVTLISVGVTDPKVGTVSCPVSTLAPGVSTTCTKTYTLTQADVDAGVVNNTATAVGTPPTGAAISASSSVSTPITRSPAIALDKQAGTLAGTTAGSALPYTFIVTNTGNVTLTSVGVNDPKAGTVTCPVTTLLPTASTTCSATYHLTQTDVDAGHVANTATVSGTAPTTAVVTAQDSTDTSVAAAPAISLSKSAGTPTSQTAGATITYTFVVTNTGNVTLHAVAVNDPMVGAVTCPTTSLVPGASTTCTKTYTVTQADVDAGVVNNSASVSGTPPTGAPVTNTATTTTAITRSPAVTLKKTAGTASGNTAGATVPYTFLVTNTGNVTVSSVGVTDAKVGTVTCPVSSLAPGVATTCTATYTLTQADVDAGKVVNSATASATPPSGVPVTATDSVTAPIAPAPSVTLKKTAGTASGNTAGSTVPYTFLVTNTGNVTLHGVAVADAKVGTVSCPVTQLAPAAATTCTATYTLKQSDVDAGKVVNSAAASANPPSGAAVTATDSVTSPITSAPKITLTKTAGTASGNKAGSTIPYTFLVTNTGNVTLTSVGVTDAKVGTVSCPVTTLTPAASTTCSATYTLTQADVDAGKVVNSASASATPPTGAPVAATATVTTPIASAPSVTLKKTSGAPSGNAAGSTIAYSFLVTNTGNVTLAGVGVTDAKVGTVSCPVSQLAPNASTTCTATYALTQADVDAGKVVNSASASANPPSGAAVTATDSVTTTITSAPKVTLKKTAGTASGNTAGSTIPYSFLVTDTGNVTLASVTVTDAKVGTVTCAVTTLAPNASTTCTATYTLTQADVDAGHVINSATASANPPSGAAVTATDTVTLPIPSAPAIAVDKQAGTATGNTAGSTIPYTFLVTNTGNVTLHAVSVSDLKAGTVTCPVSTLAPKASTTCTATYPLTQVDVDSGHVANTASASGTSPTGGAVSASDSVDTAIASTPKITLDKQAGIPSSSTAGATIPYRFVVQNIGNVTITGLVVSDAKVSAMSCPATTLAPGATTTCTATYTVTQGDVDAGHVANTATASATPPSGGPVTASDSTDTLVAPTPKITLDKQAGAPSGNTAGSSIVYSFVVTNTGNVTLTTITVDDPLAGPVSCPVTGLVPAATTTCTATYHVTQADVDAGHVANTATVSADAPSGASATATDRTDTLIPSAPNMVLSKQAGTPSGTTAGSTIVYTFHAHNTGNVTMHLLSVTDLMVGSVFCPTTILAPGDQASCTATYTLTQADVDAGHVFNTATLSAVPPAGPPVTSSDSATSTITSSPSMTFDKQAGAPSGITAGSTISYLFVVTNTGNVSLKNVAVTDARVGTVTCPATTLSPGVHVTCTATYTLTQADVDAGHVANTASASVAPPSGQPLSGSDSVDTLIRSAPKLTFDKQAGTPTGVGEGSTIPYAFVVTNTGNVTLNGLAIADAKVGSITCPATTLAPGATTTCTASYTLTQTDVDAGHVANTASVSATPPTGSAVSGTDSTDTPIVAAPSISIHKYAGTASGNAAGSVIPYTFQVANTGNVTLTSVALADAKVVGVTCPVTVLAPRASMTCTAIYTLTQADVDAGHVANTASVSAAPPSGSPVASSDSIDTLVPAAPGVSLDKQSGTLSGHTQGSTIPYTFIVTNTGNVSLAAIVINDPVVGAPTCLVTMLAPHTSTSCSATYTLEQTDVDAGHVANTASVSATPPSGSAVTSSDSTDTPVDASPGIDITKHALAASGNTAMSTIPYTFDVMNVGEVTLTNIAISDARVGTVTCPVTELAPGKGTTCTASYTLSQADVDAGHVSNTATVTSLDPSGALVTHYDTVDTMIPSSPVVTLDKQAGTPTGAAGGATIPYSFVVTNAGNVTLSSVSIADPKVGTVSCPASTLAPGAETTCTAPYTLTQADVDAGHVANTATVTAEPPSGTVVSSTDSTNTLIAASPALTLDKQAAAPSGTIAGATISYSFVVTNTGNVTLHSVSVSDPTAGAVSCPTTTLLPGVRITCTLTYTVAQADVDAGHLADTATAAGTPPIGGPVGATDSVDSPLPSTPSMTLRKTAGAPTGYTAGSTILYSFLVTNTGNVTLSTLVVDDPLVGPVSCPTTLAPGRSVTCTAMYTMTQADVDFGEVENTASVSANPPIGGPVSATDSTKSAFVTTPVLTLDKQALAPSGNTQGSTIQYSFVASNTGNVTLHLLNVDDPKVGSVFCPATTLAPGDAVTCSATYTLKQADVDAGHVPNTATASALPPSGAAVTATGSKDTIIPSAPSVSLDKQAGAPSGTTIGSTIPYSFVVTNTGTVTLTAVVVDDPLVGPVFCPTTTLAPGGHTTCTATYTLLQSDVNAGHVYNAASVSADPPSGAPVTAHDTNDISITSNPSIALLKRAGTHISTIGASVPYTFLVTNTGNVTLTAIGMSDAKVGPVSCPVSLLAPGASTTCTATYTLAQADVDAGHVLNTATVSATPPTGATVSATDSVDTAITAGPQIALDKSAGAPSSTTVGATIAYTFLVTNSGNVTLHAISVSDPRVTSVTCPVSQLAPGEDTTCTASYTVTQADVDAGHVPNTATVSGTPPQGAAVNATDTADSTIPASPSITLKKSAGTASGNTATSTIPYTFLMTNTGNVTVHGVSVSDERVGTVSCPVGDVAPGGSVTCSATYTLTQSDVDLGHVDNSATASATPPTGAAVTAGDSIITPVASTPSITVVKSAGGATGNTAGSTIPYSFLVTNRGNVTVHAVAVSDPKVSPVTCPVTQLAPGVQTTCTGTYTLTQGDADAGHVANSATASATPPTGAPVSATHAIDTPITASAKVTLDKQAGTPSGATATSTVPYTFLVTNAGSVTLTGITVNDPTVGVVACTVTTLVPGASTTCTATYALTQTDVDAGHVTNSATVSANPPSGAAVTASDQVDTTIQAAPSVDLLKTAGTATGITAGSTIPYAFLVTNTGNVTLTAIGVTDAKVGTVTCPTIVSLAPGVSATCTASYTLTQADVDAGHVVNTATASGTPPTGAPTTHPASVDTPVPAAPQLTLTKAGRATGTGAGSPISYTFLVTNTGNVTLHGVTVADPKIPAVTCPTVSVAPGASTTCTGTYVMTQDDVDLGVVPNVAVASALSAQGTLATAPGLAVTPIPAAPQVTIVKSAGPVGGNTVGATIPYTFLVTNTGNVTLHGIAVSDPKVGTVFCPVTDLAPTTSVTCTATYALTLADVNAGHVANSATVSANPPQGGPVSATSAIDTAITPAPSVTLQKHAAAPSGVVAGATILYSLVVTNTGNVTLTNIAINDPLVGTVTCPATTLDPNGQVTCTVMYAMTQDDIDAGVVVNQASVSAGTTLGTDVTDSASTETAIPSQPALTLHKSAATPTGTGAGSTITYSLLVTNTGNVTLGYITVSDPTAGPVSCPDGTVAPSVSTTCTVTYTLTQSDIDAGHIQNSAVAYGNPPSGDPVSLDDDATATDTLDTPLVQKPSVQLIKTAGTPTSKEAGGEVSYTFRVTNIGNVTLTGIAVADPLVGPVTCPVTVLAPGAGTTCTATYTLTQADIDAGHVTNHATMTATPPLGGPITASDTIDTLLVQNPELTFTKHADAAQPVAAGDDVTFTFLVTNTGNVTLSSLVVKDPMLALVSCPATSLVPGAQVLCTGSVYTVTDADASRGWIKNTAVASVLGAELEAGTIELTATSTVTITTVTTLTQLPNTGSPISVGSLVASLVILGLGIMLTSVGRRRREQDKLA